MKSNQNIILIDGKCSLCNGFVQFVIRNDRKGRFAFGTLQSEPAKQLLRETGRDSSKMESIVLYQSGRVYTKSTAALRIFSGLSTSWHWIAGFRRIPRPVRDIVYDWVARNRYRLFGKKDRCIVPGSQLRSRFLS